MKEHYTDEELTAMIRSGGPQLERALRVLDQNRDNQRTVRHFVLSRGGRREDAEEIWSEGLCAAVQAVRTGRYEGRGSLHAYVAGICRGLWLNRTRSKHYGRLQLTAEERELDAVQLLTPERQLLDEERKSTLRSVLGRLSERCAQVLRLWSEGFAMQEIAQALGLSSERIAINERLRCHKSLIKLLDEEPALQETLKRQWT
jgi:RNA polymerase sigma-70 factor (ECF subfamily)